MRNLLLLLLVSICFNSILAQIPIKVNKKFGFEDKNKMIITPKFDNARYFDNIVKLAPVKIKGKWGFINIDGVIVIKPIYQDAFSFCEGLAQIKKGNKWGFINLKGKIIIKPDYNKTYSFSNGFAQVSKITSGFS